MCKNPVSFRTGNLRFHERKFALPREKIYAPTGKKKRSRGGAVKGSENDGKPIMALKVKAKEQLFNIGMWTFFFSKFAIRYETKERKGTGC